MASHESTSTTSNAKSTGCCDTITKTYHRRIKKSEEIEARLPHPFVNTGFLKFIWSCRVCHSKIPMDNSCDTFINEAPKCYETISEWRVNVFTEYVDNQGSALKAWGFAISTTTGMALLGAFGGFIEPCSAGSGMPEVIAYLNGAKIRKYISWRTLFLKVFGLICINSAGLFSGYDGPMAHVGTIVAVLILKAFRKFRHVVAFDRDHSLNVQERRSAQMYAGILHKRSSLIYAATGAAAGVASAFKSPLAGVMFALEEAVSFFEPSLIVRTLTTTLVSYLIVGSLTKIKKLGASLSMMAYTLWPLDADCLPPLQYGDLLSFLALGMLGGLVGHFYNTLVTLVLKFRLKYLWSRPWLRIFEVALVSILTMTIVIYVPVAWDTCTPFSNFVAHVQRQADTCSATCNSTAAELIKSRPDCFENVCLQASSLAAYQGQLVASFENVFSLCSSNPLAEQSVVNLEQLANQYSPPERFLSNEEEHCYYPLRSLFWTTPQQAIQNLFSRGVFEVFHPMSLGVFGLLYLVISLLTYSILLPTDLVMPNLVFGATMGRMFGLLLNLIKAKMNLPMVDPGAFALLGAMSFWSGTSRLLMTIALVSIESTLDLSLLPGILISVLASIIVGNLLGDSQYHMELHLRRIPYLPHEAPRSLKIVEVSEIMTRNPVSVYKFMSPEEVKGVLQSCRHNGFPVLSTGYEHANCSSSTLLVDPKSATEALDSKVASVSGPACESPATLADRKVDISSKQGQLVGVILRHQLSMMVNRAAKIMESRQASSQPNSSEVDGTTEAGVAADLELGRPSSMVSDDSTDSGSGTMDSERAEGLDGDDLGQTSVTLNVGAVMIAPPITVQETMSAHKAFQLFRQCTLRHLCVVNVKGELVGILTRKNFSHASHDPLHSLPNVEQADLT